VSKVVDRDDIRPRRPQKLWSVIADKCSGVHVHWHLSCRQTARRVPAESSRGGLSDGGLAVLGESPLSLHGSTMLRAMGATQVVTTAR
jgi:hypothetical protein